MHKVPRGSTRTTCEPRQRLSADNYLTGTGQTFRRDRGQPGQVAERAVAPGASGVLPGESLSRRTTGAVAEIMERVGGHSRNSGWLETLDSF
jgi:hypothetical protein